MGHRRDRRPHRSRRGGGGPGRRRTSGMGPPGRDRRDIGPGVRGVGAGWARRRRRPGEQRRDHGHPVDPGLINPVLDISAREIFIFCR